MTAAYPHAALAPETAEPLILALPKGRILSECGPLLARAGLQPDAGLRQRIEGWSDPVPGSAVAH